MSGLSELERAADEAREQVREAREALATTRAERSGGPARNVREAERQLLALRDAVATDVRELRDRVTGRDPAAARTLRIAAVTTAGVVTTVVAAGLLGRRSITRGTERRRIEQQAIALARAIAERASGQDTASAASSGGRRRGGAGSLALLALGAAAVATVVKQRSAPIDPDDLWLPERAV